MDSNTQSSKKYNGSHLIFSAGSLKSTPLFLFYNRIAIFICTKNNLRIILLNNHTFQNLIIFNYLYSIFIIKKT